MLYPWKAKHKTWSTFPTVEVIGVIKLAAEKLGITCAEQTARTGKGFFKDPMLKRVGLYIKGQQHARDAIRHAAYYLIFSSD